MIFRQFFDQDTYTYTYLLGCKSSRKAILIDSVVNEVDCYLQTLNQLNLTLVYTLETHIHADHVTASGLLRDKLGSKSIVHRDAGAMCADILVTDGVELQLGEINIRVLHTPGHTNGCISFLIDDRLFTGDSLLINSCGRTDFQQGDSSTLFHSIKEKLFKLPGDTLVYPGHDYQGQRISTIAQEKQLNPRVGDNVNLQDFIQIMGNLNLTYPKNIDQALPANQVCGQTAIVRQG